MTLHHEHIRAQKLTEDLLLQIVNSRLPKAVREKASQCLRHLPSSVQIEDPTLLFDG